MKELKIGERVTITLEAVEQTSCVGCCFDNGDILYATDWISGTAQNIQRRAERKSF